MSTTDTKRLTRRMFDEIWNEKDRAKIDEFYHEDFVGHGFGAEDGDVDGYKEWFDVITAAFPDLHFTVDNLFEDGDLGGCTWTATGTNEGSFMGFDPTNEKSSVQGVSVHRVKDGKITEAWMQYDAMKVLQTVGAMPEQAPAADD